MKKIYAQILGGIVRNTIVVSDDTPLELFSQGYDVFIRIDDLEPRPGIGYSYDGSVFTLPQQDTNE